MIILVTNDDGFYSEGITAMADGLERFAEVWVIAPEKEQNAVGRSLTLHRPLKVTQIEKNRFIINGTPSDCVNLGVNDILPRRPSLVISGINKGGNLGDDILYSGTVAAAFEAAILGIPAFAVSLVCRQHFNFSPAASFTSQFAEAFLKNGSRPNALLNINVPDTGGNVISEYRITKQGKSIYADESHAVTDPRGKKYYWIGGEEVYYKDIPGSDYEAITKHMISITPLQTDLTDYSLLERMKKDICEKPLNNNTGTDDS